jgi:site-specific DNA-methyltransferase (adenine-specific)
VGTKTVHAKGAFAAMNTSPTPAFQTKLGELYEADCMSVLPIIKAGSVDTVFADPPFNLKKHYGRRSSDERSDQDYLAWCRKWLVECVRVLKPGGSLFLYNLPKWNIILGAYLIERGLTFRHWIAVEHKSSLPIAGRLYPAHYSLLYYSLGKPKTFNRIRTPIETCRHCGGEIRDYGGHRKAMNPKGVNLKDVWTDIPPVRHRKFKSDQRASNAISTKILERVIEMSTVPGDLVLDPFGGSGTTYSVCERRHRHWIGIEIESVEPIKERLIGKIEHHRNNDFVERSRIVLAAE